jgi:hypothetical protein
MAIVVRVALGGVAQRGFGRTAQLDDILRRIRIVRFRMLGRGGWRGLVGSLLYVGVVVDGVCHVCLIGRPRRFLIKYFFEHTLNGCVSSRVKCVDNPEDS